MSPISRSALLVLLAASTLATAQTSTTHRRTTARKPATPAPCAEPAPVTPAGLPPAEGKVQKAYALRYIDTQIGTGELAPDQGTFTVHYTGWLASDGTKFDSSVDRGQPITIHIGPPRPQVIVGWDTGFAGMRVGGKRRLFIPYQLAYGVMGHPPVIPAKADLIFDVELVSVGDQSAPQNASAPAPANQPAAK